MSSGPQNYRVRSRLEVFYTGGAVRVSHDGTTLACACGDEVKLVELETGAVLQTFPGDSEPITALAWSPDGKTVFAASRSLQMKFWSVETGKAIRTFKAHKAPIADMVVDPSGGMLATASSDRTVRVWDIDGGFCTHSFGGHSGIILSVAFHPRQLMLYTAGDDSQIKVWDLVTKSCIATLKGHFSAVTCLSLSQDGWTLLSGGRDGVVMAWDLRKHEKIGTVPVYEPVEGVVALPSSISTALCGASSGLCFATGGEKGLVKVWRLDTAQQVVDAMSGKVVDAPVTAAGGIVELKPLPHGRGLLAATQDCRLVSYSFAKNEFSVTRQLIGNNDDITDIRCLFLRDTEEPTHIVVATNSEHIRIFDAKTLSCTATLAGHTDIVLALDTLKTKGGTTLVASGSKDNTVRLWAILDDGAKCIGVGTGHIGAVGAVAFSQKSGGFFVSGGADKLLKVWDISTITFDTDAPAKLKATATVAAHDKDINALAIAPNDSIVVTGSQDRTVKVWQLPDLVQDITLKGHKRGVWSVALSPADKIVATCSGDKTIKMWSLKDGSCLRTFEGHLASVLRVSYLGNHGSQLLSSGADGLLKLWSVKSSECVASFDAHNDKVWALATANSGKMLCTGGGDGSIAVWEDCTGHDEEERLRERESDILKEQDLANALQQEDFDKAAMLALEMKRPGKLLAVVNQAFDLGPERATAIVQGLVSGLDTESLKLCLEFCREWNSNGKTCFAAQAVLNAIFKLYSPQELQAVPGMAMLLEGLLPYTQRHFSRVDRLLRSTFLVDYVLGVMNVLTPVEEEDVEAPIAAATTATTKEKKKKQKKNNGNNPEDDTSTPMQNGNGKAAAAESSEGEEEDRRITRTQAKKKKKNKGAETGSAGKRKKLRSS